MAEPKRVAFTFDSVVGTGAAPIQAVPTGRDLESDAPIPELPQGRWPYSICGCFSRPASCCATFWCGSCTIGQASSISVGGSATRCLVVAVAILCTMVIGYGLQFGEGEAVMALAFVFSVVGSCLAFVVIYLARRELRVRQKLEGSDFEDCCLALCCNLCSVCQILNLVPGRYKGPFATYDSLGQDQETKEATEPLEPKPSATTARWV